MKLKIYADQVKYLGNLSLFFVLEYPNGDIYLAKPMELVFEKADETATRPEPTLQLDRTVAREFFPALHEAMIESGYLAKPKESENDAMKYHLEDMRRLVFKEEK